jgi:hypothetical protein
VKYISVILFLLLFSCKKEVEYPDSIVGTWEYLGLGKSFSNLYRSKDHEYVRITVDSMFIFRGSLDSCINKVKVEFDDDYFVSNSGYPRALKWYVPYWIDESNIGYLLEGWRYWIYRDIMQVAILEGYDFTGDFGYYQFRQKD